MSPEQARGEDVDHRTDIWSFGVVLYEMITGQLPFKGEYEQAVIYSILNKAPEPVQKYRPDLASDFLLILNLTLDKQPDHRYQSMKDVLIDLNRIKRDQDKDYHKSGVVQKTEVSSKAKSQQKTGQFLWFAVAFTIIVLVLISKFLLNKTESLPPPKTSILTSYEGSERHPALSPDGSKLAFTWRGIKQDNYDIYIKLIGQESFQRLTSDSADDYGATWSNDGNSIVFIRDGKNAGIYRKSTLGARETKLHSFGQNAFIGEIIPTVDWSPDGEWLVYNDLDTSGQTQSIFMLNLTTLHKKQLTFSVPYIVGDMAAKFSPDGQLIAFQRVYSWGIVNLYILHLKNGTLQQLTFDKKDMTRLAWTQNGKQIVFSSNRDGIARLWRISIKGGHPEIVETGGQNAYHPSISRNGNRLVFETKIIKGYIWQADILKQESKIIKPYKLISLSYADAFPVYSPDGKRIAFGSERTGNSEIYTTNSDGTNPIQLTSLNAHSNVPRWSPSGESIVFDSRPDGNSDILIIDAEGAKPPQNLTKHPSDDRLPSWSADGLSIYFGSNRSGEYQIHKMSVTGGNVVQITQNGGFFGQESADGKYFYFIKRSNPPGPIYQIDLENGKETMAVKEEIFFTGWVVKTTGIYYIPANRNETYLEFYRFDTGTTEQIGLLEKWLILSDISNDAKHVLFWLQETSSDIYLIDNFN